jgi:hypothetical protein
MIAALAKGAAALDRPEYARVAKKAADFILEHLRDSEGQLLKRYRNGQAGLPAHLDDYAFMVWGLLELYEATFETGYLEQAIELNRQMLDNFWDEENGGLYFSAAGQKDLLVRSKEVYDGAIPSGNSVAAMNLLRIGRITTDSEMERRALDIARAFSKQVTQVPMGHTHLVSSLLFYYATSYEVVISGSKGSEDTEEMIAALRAAYMPNKVVLFRPADGDEDKVVRLAPFTQQQTTLDGRATVYVCRDYACNRPTTDIDNMLEMLRK